MTRWYAPTDVKNGIKPGLDIAAPNFPPFGKMTPGGQYSGFPVGSFETFVEWFGKQTSTLNRQSYLDYVYYFSETAYMREDHGQWFAHAVDKQTFAQDQASSKDTHSAFALLGMPDTTLWGLGDFSYMFEKGIHPVTTDAGQDVIILSWVSALAWGWRTGALMDVRSPHFPESKAYLRKIAEKNHPNFSRLIWIMFTRVKAHAAAAKNAAPTKAPDKALPKPTHAGDVEAHTTDVGAAFRQQAEQTPWGLIALAVLGIFGAAAVAKRDRRDE
jgi:hypothetical protein